MDQKLVKNSDTRSVFIASSRESIDNGYLTPIEEVLIKNGFTPKVWDQEFPGGKIIIQNLVKIVNESDYAIFIFSNDLIYNRRKEKNQKGAAWNVILEFGMFYQQLRDRTIILRIKGAHIPTDLGGLVYHDNQSQT